MSLFSKSEKQEKDLPQYPGLATVIHGNGAVAHVMAHVCGGVIGFPITPSTEISEIYEEFRAQGGCNIWGEHPFFFEPEGEHSAQSGALGAALTGGKYVSNASSSQGILYALESHYVTVGKKAAGFVLHVAARSVSRNSINVMAGHDDVYALLSAGYNILFASNAQEAADLAAISYRVSSLSLIPVANTMDGFSTSHIQSQVLLPEPEMLKKYLGDPKDRITAPTEAQRMLYGAKGRVWQLTRFIEKYRELFWADKREALENYLNKNSEQLEGKNNESLLIETNEYVPCELQNRWKRTWQNAYEKDTRKRVPALVDTHNPGATGGLQNQPDYQAGIVDHHTHFMSHVPKFIEQAMEEYTELTGRKYEPVMDFMCNDAQYLLLGLGSVTDDAEAVASYLRTQGHKVGVISIKQLNPFPEAQLIEKIAGKKSVTILERCDETRLTERVSRALFKACENANTLRHKGIRGITNPPQINTGVFGLGGHDLQPCHLVAAFENMFEKNTKPFFYLGSQFFEYQSSGELNKIQRRLLQAYPDTQLMALETRENPNILPEEAIRIRFHSIGGYGTIATGKLLTDILAGALGLNSKSMPKYGSEKGGSPTNFFITLSPDPIKITNAELLQVEVALSPDHKVFIHTNPLAGLVENGTFILQSSNTPKQVWQDLPQGARQYIREKKINFYIINAFEVAHKHAPTPDLEIRMMGIAFIGALCGHAKQIIEGAYLEQMLERIEKQINKKFGKKGEKVVSSNMAVIRGGVDATQAVNYAEFSDDEEIFESAKQKSHNKGNNASCALFDQEYFDNIAGKHYANGTISEAPVIPGSGMFLPPASAISKNKGLCRLNVPYFNHDKCTGCMECTVACPEGAIPNAVHELHDIINTSIGKLNLPPTQLQLIKAQVQPICDAIRHMYRTTAKGENPSLAQLMAKVVDNMRFNNEALKLHLVSVSAMVEKIPMSRTRVFFDAMENDMPGSGGLFSVAIDPTKCTGCMECVDVCGANALTKVRETSELNTQMAFNFNTLAKMPKTPIRFIEQATKSSSKVKYLLLDHDNYYAMNTGHGACRGCGEVTPIRLVLAINRALKQQGYTSHIKELENLIEKLTLKLTSSKMDEKDPNRSKRIKQTIKTLSKRLFLFENGPTGNGPSDALISNATGCSSVYSTTFPANSHNNPWVNSLFQDSPAISKGLFEGEVSNQLAQIKAIRSGKLDLDDLYDPEIHDKQLRYLEWTQFTDQELALLPTVFSIGGDGATYDIGFGSLSRLLTTSTPIKILVLNTGSYSNTGGQTSTASFTAQDTDLSRFGSAHRGKEEVRKELGILALFHPKVMVIQSSAGIQGHFMSSLLEYLNYQDSPALFDVYTPCMSEHGISDDASMRHSKWAVESRMNPVFFHDPRKGETLADRLSLDGNPELLQDWAMQTISYTDQDGMIQLKQVPFTPADFASHEGRFKKHFKPIDNKGSEIEVADHIKLSLSQRIGKVPFIWSKDKNNHLIKLSVSSSIIALTEDRLRNWRMLQYLSGQNLVKMEQELKLQINQWHQSYDQAVKEKENAIDTIANGLAELALTANAKTSGQSIPVTQMEVAQSVTPSVTPAASPLVFIADGDQGKCTNCKTCYQQLGELFEKVTIVDQGVTKEVGQIISGALEKIQITDELISLAARVAAECDAEIIKFNQPATKEL